MLQKVPIIRRTGYDWAGQSVVPPLRHEYCVVGGVSIGGDAPKDFIRVYEYGTGRRNNPKSWPAYIAKVGHKWYPGESITEHLLTRIGQCLGLRMAESKLMLAAGQIRFLSRYFLRSDESLVHGAEIFAGYLEDPAFVSEVEKQKKARELFTFQVICEAVRARFPVEGGAILRDYVQMLAFDSLVGNNDRHIYNWGVIVHAKGRRPSLFSPIYDSARGLFWNIAEDRLGRYRSPARLYRYVGGSQPQVGWDGEHGAIDHFQLVARIAEHFPEFRSALCGLGTPDALEAVSEMLDREFGRLLSDGRRTVIRDCLRLRFQMYSDTVEKLCGRR